MQDGTGMILDATTTTTTTRRDVALPGEQLIKQGAEALAFRSHFLPGLPCLRKHRPRKAYRHPILDAKLTRHRILSEARVLQKCLRAGVPVPKLYFCDVSRGDLYMEFLPGVTVHAYLSSSSSSSSSSDQSAEGRDESMEETEEMTKVGDKGKEEKTMERIGETIAAMHAQDIIHGDLTTSNILVSVSSSSSTTDGGGANDGAREKERRKEEEVWLIDFGLGSPSGGVEEKAVDLYVLERAFLSTHPACTSLFHNHLLPAYARFSSSWEAGTTQVLKRLEAVRLRGRKRAMIG